MPKGPKPESHNVAPTYADERFVDTLFDQVKFGQLLQLAETVCLRGTPDYPTATPELEGEAKVIDKFGTRGLRLAFELYDGYLEVYDPKPFESNSPDDPRIYPIDRPEYFNGPINREMLAKAEAFGKQLLDEAYNVLGSDADAYVALFRDATTTDEQFTAIDWLVRRLQSLTGRRGLQSDPDEEARLSYHPLRLSPKVIGRYPDHKVGTTCLGAAIIGASFFRKAGADIMHAGVMQSHVQSEIIDCISMMYDAMDDDSAKQFGAELPDLAKERLTAKIDEVYDIFQEDRGTHSAVYVRMVNGRWFQLDPNYNANTVLAYTMIDGEEVYEQDAAADEAYATLTQLKDIAPGLELSRYFGITTIQDTMRDVLNAVEVGETYRSDIEQLLDTMSEESTIEPFRDYIVGKIRQTVEKNEQWLKWAEESEAYEFFYKAKKGQRLDSVLENDFYAAFEKFVQWDMPIDEWRVRCQSDPEFRRNRVEDIMRLPSVVSAKYALSTQGQKETNGPHTSVELGLPDLRIGLSVLNNFALYFDDSLSAHHWLSQWSSHLAVIDRLHHANRSRAQKLTLINGSLDLQQRDLRYAVTGGKITTHADLLDHSTE